MASPMMILSRILGGPRTRNPDELTEFLMDQEDKSDREREVAEYIARASGVGGLDGRGGTGSLKYVLWALRDHLEDDYNDISTMILSLVLGEYLSIDNTRGDISDLGIMPRFTPYLYLPPPEISDIVDVYHVGDLVIAVNYTRRNLLKIVFDDPFVDAYLAVSKRGSTLVSKKPNRLADIEGWKRAHDDMLIRYDEAGVESTLAEIPFIYERVEQ